MVKNKAGEDNLRKIYYSLQNKNCITLEAGKETKLLAYTDFSNCYSTT